MTQSTIEADAQGSDYTMLILRSPLGVRYSVTIDEDGVLVTTEVT